MGNYQAFSEAPERRSRSRHFGGDARAAGRSAQERPGRQAGPPLASPKPSKPGRPPPARPGQSISP